MENLQTPSHHPLPPTPPPSDALSLADKISPSVLLIIIILAIIFFVSGLLHLLIRLLFRPRTRHPPDLDTHAVTALQGQLRQLFHLHDSGVDQSFIDTLPVFLYKSIIGVKDPFDCAVCLCEFEPDHKLRLLPKCSHAFHTDCIDTWLLSHSTCPLCRATLLQDFSPCAPIVCVLEAGVESSREVVNGGGGGSFGSNRVSEIELSVKESEEVTNSGGKIVTVKLGKFRNVDESGENSNNNNDDTGNKKVNSRRCFSMGSFAYVMDETTSLQVPIMTPAAKKQRSAKKIGFLPLKPGHRSAISEYGSDSRREFKGESFSVSKIWKRSNGDSSNSKRAFSFRFPIGAGGSSGGGAESVSTTAAAAGSVGGRRTISEVEDIAWWESGGIEMNCGDEETLSCYSVESMTMNASSSSSTKRTLLWLMGKQPNKVIHSSHTSNV